MNNNKTILIASLGLVIGGLAVFCFMTVCQNHDGKSEYDRYSKEAGMHTMHDGSVMKNTEMGNMKGMEHMHMMVTSERMFLEHMIPHHEEAVTTAKEVLERGGTTAEIKTLAQNIITAQEKEIANMKAWYQSWYGEAYTDKNVYTPMMRDLKSLSGKDLDKVFLEDMIMHHMGAIMMAESVASYISHTEMTDLTKAIITSQTAEIGQMKTMLGGL